MDKYPVILTVSGTDPCGGAGVAADIKTATALRVVAMPVITAVVAQNSEGIKAIQAVEPEILKLQLEAAFQEEPPKAMKIGMVADAQQAKVIADCIRKYELKNVVIDPVIAATSGGILSEDSLSIAQILLPEADIVTPNLPETVILLGHEVESMEDMAVELREKYGCKSVLLKGGHRGGEDYITDFYSDELLNVELCNPKVKTENLHGTGCALSTAIASAIALGKYGIEALKFAEDFVHKAIYYGADYQFGRKNGLLNYFFNIPSYETDNQ